MHKILKSNTILKFLKSQNFIKRNFYAKDNLKNIYNIFKTSNISIVREGKKVFPVSVDLKKDFFFLGSNAKKKIPSGHINQIFENLLQGVKKSL